MTLIDILRSGGKLLGGIGKFLGKLGGSAWKAAKHYASKNGPGLFKAVTGGLADKALNFIRRKPPLMCGCFTATTLVLTPAGAVPIDSISEDAIVLAADDEGEVSDVVPGEVGQKIIIGEASLLHLTIQHADGEIETINTTDEHPFHLVIENKWVRADHLQSGDPISALKGDAVVVSVSYGTERVPVYNLSIPGSPTYYVGEHGVWVHNCGFDQLFKVKYEHFMHRKGWDTILGKANPSRREVASVLEQIVTENGAHLSRLQPNSITKVDITGVYNGHTVFVQVSSRTDGLYEITSAGLP